MLVYEGVKSSFINDVDLNLITDKILNRFKEVFHRSTGESEVNSWRESMLRMRGVLAGNEIPDNAGVAIEFNIPHTSNRIDFLLSGYDKNKNNSIIIELKQWTHADAVSGKDGVVSTVTGRALREVTHPSHQAWSYASLIDNYNQEVYDRNVGLHPCAFLHNYDLTDNDPINSEQYKDYINAAQMFGAKDFENQRVTLKDNGSIDEIKKYAKNYNTGIYKMDLKSQFRCDGSDGYLAWLDNTLEIRETANFDLDSKYDFKVFDDPNELRRVIEEKII